MVSDADAAGSMWTLKSELARIQDAARRGSALGRADPIVVAEIGRAHV